MNVRIAITALGLLAANSSFAQEVTHFPAEKATSTLSRAEVSAQVIQARNSGQLLVNDADFAHLSMVAGTASRDAVKADLRQARLSGEFDRLNAETYSPPPVAAKSAVRTPVVAASRG